MSEPNTNETEKAESTCCCCSGDNESNCCSCDCCSCSGCNSVAGFLRKLADLFDKSEKE